MDGTKKWDRRAFVVESAKAGTALAGLSLVPASLRNEVLAAEPTSAPTEAGHSLRVPSVAPPHPDTPVG